MNTLLSKEYRAIWPFWLVAAALPLAPLLLASRSEDAMMWSVIGYGLGSALLGAVIFGFEWSHRTMDMLLVQPISRHRLWHGKMRVLGFTLVTVVIAFMPSVMSMPGDTAEFFRNPYGAMWVVLPMLWAAGAGPFFTLRTGNSLSAFVFSILTPFLWVMAMQLLLPANWTRLAINEDGSTNDNIVSMMALFVYGVPLVLFAAAAWRKARCLFQNLETADVYGSMPVLLTAWQPVKLKSSSARSRKRSAAGAMIIKELRLHESSYIMAGCVGLASALAALYQFAWAALNSESFASDPWPANFVLLMGLLLAFIIPVTVGSSAVADERQMGVLESQLALPPSRRKQWTIKLLVTAAIHCALGMVLPVILIQAAGWIGLSKPHVFNFDDVYSALLSCGASLLALVVFLFASSLAKTTLRAMLTGVGTILLACLLAGTFLYLMDYLQSSDVRASWNAPAGDARLAGAFMIVLFLLGSGYFKYILASLLAAALTGFIVWLGLSNYRRLQTRLGAFAQIALVSLILVLLSVFPFTMLAFRQIDARSQVTGLSGRALAAHLTRQQPELVITAIDNALDDAVQGPNAIGELFEYADYPEAVPVMLRALSHPSIGLRIQAEIGLLTSEQWRSLLQREPGGMKQMVEALTQNLQESDLVLRYYAMLIFAKTRSNLEQTVPAMVRLLEESSKDHTAVIGPFKEVLSMINIRVGIVEALEKLRSDAWAAVPVLEKIVQDDPKGLKLGYPAFKALQAINPEKAKKYDIKNPLSPRRAFMIEKNSVQPGVGR